jgi:serine/threonine protein kinase
VEILSSRIANFEVIRQIGSGGMGAVYLGRDVELNRPVAIKVIREEIHELETLDRFFQEARAAAALRHPNIITMYASGQHEHQPYMVMEFVDGESLADIIREGRDVPVLKKLSYLEQLCSGLHFAHRAGIIHRDVKPANVMVDREGTVRILDFGIARIEGSALTQGGALLGSVNYMSPEQMLGRPIDHRSDIFAAGLLAYELITYRQAFKGGINDGILQRLPFEHPTPMSEICPDLPAGLEGVIGRALQKAPEDRFQDLEEMRAAIVDIQRRLESSGADDTIMILREALQASFNMTEPESAMSTASEAGVVQQALPPFVELDFSSHVEPDFSSHVEPDLLSHVEPDLLSHVEPDFSPAEPPAALPPSEPVPTPQMWQVRKPEATTRRVVATSNTPSTATSRSSSTTKSHLSGTGRSPRAQTVSRTSSPREWIVLASGAIALVAALTIPWLTAAPSNRIERERAAAAAAMERFRIGYRNRDLEAVRMAFPGLRPEAERAMARTFADCLVYEVIFDEVTLVLTSADPAVAQADVRSTHTCTPQSTGPQKITIHQDVYTLGKHGDTWVIDKVQSTPAGSVGDQRRGRPQPGRPQ